VLPADRRKQFSPRECYVRTRREVGSTTIVRKRLNSDRRGEEAATQGGEQGSSVHPGELPPTGRVAYDFSFGSHPRSPSRYFSRALMPDGFPSAAAPISRRKSRKRSASW
jgi:hypothetical protein